MTKKCEGPGCTNDVAGTRRRKYCSITCRVRAFDQRSVPDAVSSVPPKPRKPEQPPKLDPNWQVVAKDSQGRAIVAPKPGRGYGFRL